MGNDFINNLGLIISSIVSKKLQLSHLETGILSSIFSMIFVNAFNYQYNLHLHLYLLWYILPIIPILALYYHDALMYYYYKGNNMVFTPKCKLTISNPSIYDKFIIYFIDILQINIEQLNIGNVNSRANSIYDTTSDEDRINCSGNIPFVNKKFKFKDDELGYEGYVIWKEYNEIRKKSDKESTYEKKIIFNYIEVDFHNKENIIKFKKDVIKKVNKFQSNKIILQYFKILNGSKAPHSITMYNGEKKNGKELKEEFINSFFHKERNIIWNNVETVIRTPENITKLGQGAFINYIFYGPPGSGKSSLAYRLARALECNIISVDISCIKSKLELYKIIQSPKNYLNHYNSLSHIYSKKYIIVLEEFDESIKKLLEKENKRKFMNEFMSTCFQKIYVDEDNYNTENKDLTIKHDKGVFKNNMNELKQDVELLNDEYTLRDLLDILQGSLSIDGSIIIATTNNLDKIKGACPELVRDGRLTPVYFGYQTKDSFIELCQYYFKDCEKEIINDLFKNVDELSVPTSTVLKLLKDSEVLYKYTFNQFIEKIAILQKEYKNIKN